MKTVDTTLEQVEQLYTDNVKRYGNSAAAVGWKDGPSQDLRFNKLLSIVDVMRAFSMNDLGCGYGAMYRYVTHHEQYKLAQCYEYDISEEMLAMARRDIADERACWLNGATLKGSADYSFASGIFNVRFDATDDEWTRYIETVLCNMNEFSSRGFAFNLLSCFVDYRVDHLYYGDPCYFFDYCKRNFSKKVVLLHDYDLWEWTIGVIKD